MLQYKHVLINVRTKLTLSLLYDCTTLLSCWLFSNTCNLCSRLTAYWHFINFVSLLFYYVISMCKFVAAVSPMREFVTPFWNSSERWWMLWSSVGWDVFLRRVLSAQWQWRWHCVVAENVVVAIILIGCLISVTGSLVYGTVLVCCILSPLTPHSANHICYTTRQSAVNLCLLPPPPP